MPEKETRENEISQFDSENERERERKRGYFAQSAVFAQQDTADFGTLAIKNNYNVTSMTFDANRLEPDH